MSHPLIAAIRFLATEGSRNRITDANLSPIPRKVNEPKVPYHCTKVTASDALAAVGGLLGDRRQTWEFRAIAA